MYSSFSVHSTLWTPRITNRILFKIDMSSSVNCVLVIGAAGAIGKCLVEHMLEQDIHVIAGLRKTPLDENLTKHKGLKCVFGVDCVDAASIRRCFELHPTIDCVWNLAAPLSVETARNPEHAYNVVVNGMKNLLTAMREFSVPRICFSDSIGSYGSDAPRSGATAAWLVQNPTQDPGSEYGVQKRLCRDLMRAFVEEMPLQRSSRWAIIPGVLHSDESWGAGTTEYALDAIRCAVEHRPFVCPIEEHAILPMIWRDDLVKGLFALMLAAPDRLLEPEGGYALGGLSFSPAELFACLKQQPGYADFTFVAEIDTDKLLSTSPAAVCARLWPDSISAEEAARDLEFKPEVTEVSSIVARIIAASAKP